MKTHRKCLEGCEYERHVHLGKRCEPECTCDRHTNGAKPCEPGCQCGVHQRRGGKKCEIGCACARHTVPEERRARISQSSKGKTISVKVRQIIAEAQRGPCKTCATLGKRCSKHSGRNRGSHWTLSVETHERQRAVQSGAAWKTHPHSKSHNQAISRALTGIKRSAKTCQRMRVAQGKQVDSYFKKGPNNLEKSFASLSGLFFVGDGTVVIGGRWPDFLVPSQRKVVEVYGCYWHDCPTCNKNSQFIVPDPRVEHFRSYGYDCLVIWEHEINQEPGRVQQRIAEYVA